MKHDLSRKMRFNFWGSLPLLSLIVVSCGETNNLLGLPSGIRGQGSSSILPIIEAIKAASNDLQYEATGSGDGFKIGLGLISHKDFGMTSSLKHPTTSDEANKWIANKVRTITFAKDAIAIALNLPNTITGLSANNRPIVKGEMLGKLFDKDASNDQVTWDDLLENEEANEIKSLVFPMGRNGGKSASGTADGFFNNLGVVSGITNSELDTNHTKFDGSHLTAEANSAAKVALEQKENALTYLSLGYGLKNESDNLLIAIIKTAGGEVWIPSVANVISKAYNWSRPFNILFSTQNEKGRMLAKVLLQENTQKVVERLDFISLTPDEIKTQSFNIEQTDQEINGSIDLTSTSALFGIKV